MNHCKHYAQRAFTLVEIAIVLVIIGLMSAVILQSSQVTQPDNCYAATQRQLADINAAITAYARANGRYPLPAGRSFGVASPSFGREVTLPADALLIDSNGGILFGALPFQTLGLNESYAADCWGNKFSYTVTETMTAGGSVTSGGVGGITVKTGGLGGSTDILTDAVYAVISHGADGIGGVTKNYSDVGHGWCGVPTTVEMENCNTDSTVFSTTFNNGDQSGSNYFDDLIVFAEVLGSNCDAASYPKSWGDGSGPSGLSCNDTISGPITSGTSATGTSVAPAGSAHFICHNGNIELDTTQDYTCDGCTYPAGGGPPVCGGGTDCSVTSVFTWDTSGTSPGVPCSGSPDLTVPAVDGENRMVTNTTPGYTGMGSVQCQSGVLVWQQGTCTPDPVDCASLSTDLTWDVNGAAATPCLGHIHPGDLTEGGFASIPHDTVAAPDYNGFAWVQCIGGVVTIIQSPCNGTDPLACPATVLPWGAGCQATFPSVPNASNSPTVGTQANVLPGYTGSATAKCNAGVLTINWQTCNVSPGCPVTNLSWTSAGNTCTAAFGAAADTASESHPNDVALAPGMAGTGNATCNAGVWSAATGSCGPIGSVPCPEGFFTKPSTDGLATCRYFMWNTNDYAGMQSPENETPGYTGGSDIVCNHGTGAWNMLGAGCDPMTGVNSYAEPYDLTMTKNCGSFAAHWGNGCYAWNAYGNTPHGMNTHPVTISAYNTGTGMSDPALGQATFSCNNGVWTLAPGATCTKTVGVDAFYCGANPGCSGGGAFVPGIIPVYCANAANCKHTSVTHDVNCNGLGGASQTYDRYYCVGEYRTHVPFKF